MKTLWRMFLLIGLLSAAPAAFAACIPSIPYNLTNGSLADATQVMGNFNTIVTDVNTNCAHNGANSDITSLTGLTTPLAPTYGGTSVYVGGATSGSANAQVLSTTVPANVSLTSGNTVVFIPGFTNTGSTTLNVAGTGVEPLLKLLTTGSAASLTGGELQANWPAVVIYFNGAWSLVNPMIGVDGTNFTWNSSGNLAFGTAPVLPAGTTLVSGATLNSGVVATTQATSDNTTKVATDAFAHAVLVKGAPNVYQATVATPTATTSNTPVMMGLAGAATPAGSGTVFFQVSGYIYGGNDSCGEQLRFGTGTAPVNGAALTGTLAGVQVVQLANTTGANSQGGTFTVGGIVTGLTVSTTYWFDIGVNAVNGNSCQPQAVSVSAFEIK